MKSKNVKAKVKKAEKSIARVAGEVVGSIGHGIMEGKEKITEVAQSAVKKFKKFKKAAVKRKPAKKTALKKSLTKKVTAARKKVKKTAKKITAKR